MYVYIHIYTYILVFIIDSAVCTLANIRARYPKNDGFIHDRGKRFDCSSKHPDRPWCPVSLLFNKYRGIFPRGKAAEA
jgi:hypothetical protein